MSIFASMATSDRLRQYLPSAALLVLVAGIGVAEPRFLSLNALLQLAGDTVTLIVLAAGVSFVIMLGGIDLSIQSMASLASVIVALTITRLGYASFVLAILIGVFAGCCAGIAHVKLKIPSFIATLAVGGVLAGTALLLSHERSITLVESQREYLTWITGSAFGVPNGLFIGAALVFLAAVVQSRTLFGRYSAAIGAGGIRRSRPGRPSASRSFSSACPM